MQARIYARAPGRQIFRGGIKKIEIEVWYAEKKGCPQERNLREIYTVCLLVSKQEEDHFPSGIAGIVELINCTWKLN